jgi:hypothetical protein
MAALPWNLSARYIGTGSSRSSTHGVRRRDRHGPWHARHARHRHASRCTSYRLRSSCVSVVDGWRLTVAGFTNRPVMAERFTRRSFLRRASVARAGTRTSTVDLGRRLAAARVTNRPVMAERPRVGPFLVARRAISSIELHSPDVLARDRGRHARDGDDDAADRD